MTKKTKNKHGRNGVKKGHFSPQHSSVPTVFPTGDELSERLEFVESQNRVLRDNRSTLVNALERILVETATTRAGAGKQARLIAGEALQAVVGVS